jgi:hypothetical protein
MRSTSPDRRHNRELALEQLQVQTRVPHITFQHESDGLWACFAPHLNAAPVNMEATIRALENLGVPRARAEKIVRGALPLSTRNNPDLQDMMQKCRKMLPEHAAELDEVPVGYAVIPYVNAGAHTTPWGHVIRLQYGLAYLDHLNEWLLEAYEPAVAKIELLRSGVDTIAFGGPLQGVERFDSGKIGPFARMGYTLALLQRTWILLHEFGHVILGHRNGLTGKAALQQELAADEFATVAWCRHGQGEGAKPAFFLSFLFSLLAATERLVPEVSNTHPAITERKEKISRVLMAHAGSPTEMARIAGDLDSAPDLPMLLNL